jgi:hypothetical protein
MGVNPEDFFAGRASRPRRGRTAMRGRSLAATAPIATGVIATTVLAQSLSSSNAQTQPRYLPEYTAGGDLILPKDWHDWVYVGSPLTPNALLAINKIDLAPLVGAWWAQTLP